MTVATALAGGHQREQDAGEEKMSKSKLMAFPL